VFLLSDRLCVFGNLESFMVKFASQIVPSLPRQDRYWEPVVFTPLDEPTAYRILDAYFEREAEKQVLSDSSGVSDDDVLTTLVDLGFTPETLPALQLAPIAFIAWASETVSDQECRAAVASTYESRLHQIPKALGRFQSWLDIRPDRALWDLWITFTERQLEKTPQSTRNVMGERLLRQATSVAIASGGFLGMGKVCSAEQAILDMIRKVYRVR
jgi:hypothetical protein